MDYYPNSEHANSNMNSNPSAPQTNRPGGFAIASLICGIVAVTLCCTGILGIPVGAMSILFAALSKRRGQKLSVMCLLGIILSVAGIVLGVLMTVYSFYMAFNDPLVNEQVNMIMESLYGVTLDEYFDLYLGL